MKQITKGLVGLILMGMISQPLYAHTVKERIFPEYTGLKAKTNLAAVSVRNYPSEYSDELKTADEDSIYVLGKNNGWYRVKIGTHEGWISRNELTLPEHAFIPYSKVLGEEIVSYGKRFIGTPYVWGGNDLKHGVDCSGLTKKVFEGFDINISRLSYTQVNDGKKVKKSELRPGDLVFFDTSGVNNGQISHVGIYAGDGLFLHADCTKGVTLSKLSNAYYTRNYVTGSRILNHF